MKDIYFIEPRGTDLLHSAIRLALILGLLTLSTWAQAEILASLPNQAGGEILWLSGRCGSENDGWLVASTSDGGLVLNTGCAHSAGDNRVMIQWTDGNLSVIQEVWDVTAAGKRLVAGAYARAKAPPSRTYKAPPAKTAKYRM